MIPAPRPSSGRPQSRLAPLLDLLLHARARRAPPPAARLPASLPLLCAPIASALISHPFSSASAKTGYGVSDGKYGGVVLFAGLAMGVGAGLEAVEWLLSSPKRVA